VVFIDEVPDDRSILKHSNYKVTGNKLLCCGNKIADHSTHLKSVKGKDLQEICLSLLFTM